MELTSILCPAYNAQRYLQSCVDSIQHQTLKFWELVICNDGSTDQTGHIADYLASRDMRIKVIHSQHQGYAEAFNVCLRAAQGSVIARQDADDLSHWDRLETQYRVLGLQPNRIVSCGMIRLFPDGRILNRQVTGMDARSYVTREAPSGPCGASLVCCRSVYDQVGGFDKEFNASADSDWNFRALALRDSPEWIHIAQDLYIYRQHSQQMTKANHKEGQKAHTASQLKYKDVILERLGHASGSSSRGVS